MEVFETLCDIYEGLTVNQAIIYCNRKRKAQCALTFVKKILLLLVFGDMTQKERISVIDAFKSGVERILIATDIVAGIDVQQVSRLLIMICQNIKKHTFIVLEEVTFWT